MVEYYKKDPDYKVYFHVVGDFSGEQEKQDILPLIDNNNLNKYVILYGKQHGEKLDDIFDSCDMGIGSLGRHRSGITNIKTLKNREYAARGIPFIYSETDSDFDLQSYVLKEPADESSINIDELIAFYKNKKWNVDEIRDSIKHLSWNEQISKVVNMINL